jgi:hypothetical protein
VFAWCKIDHASCQHRVEAFAEVRLGLIERIGISDYRDAFPPG